MKLAGPKPGIRLHVGRPDRPGFVRAIVVGVFPPENAAEFRDVAQEYATAAEPRVRKQIEEAQRQYIDRLIHGDPNAPEPKGLIRGTSPLEAIRRDPFNPYAL